MKAIYVPYARPEDCAWAQDPFPHQSIAALPVCGKPIIGYVMDELYHLGVTETMVLDGRYDQKLATYLGDGSKWGMKLIYVGGGDCGDEATLRQRHSAFIGGERTIFMFGNRIVGRQINSLKAYYDINMELLRERHACVIPGYSAEPGVYIGSDVIIRPGADVKGPVSLGDGVDIARGAVVHPYTVLGEKCVVDRGARIGESVIFAGTYVGKHVEFIRKIVSGSRVIDPFSGAYVDLDGDGISESVEGEAKVAAMPVPHQELALRNYTGVSDARVNAELADILAEIARDVAALNLPKIIGVYLGGGYGRGEGGSPLYNDLDFFPLVRDLTEPERSEIQVALDALGMAYGMRLGIHVDFCRPKTKSDFKKDERRIMIQEFIRGNVPIIGHGDSLDFLTAFEPEDLPPMEAVRTLVNRGMGLYLARDSEDPAFVKRNINKAVLGSGDAVLVAKRQYRWSVVERARTLKDDDYTRAVELKFRPTGEAAVTWEAARSIWLFAVRKVLLVRGFDLRQWSFKEGVRYVVRRRRLGRILDFGLDPLLRILMPLEKAISDGTALDPEVMKDWHTFN